MLISQMQATEPNAVAAEESRTGPLPSGVLPAPQLRSTSEPKNVGQQDYASVALNRSAPDVGRSSVSNYSVLYLSPDSDQPGSEAYYSVVPLDTSHKCDFTRDGCG